MEAYLVGMVLLILQVLQPKLALFYLLGLFLAVLLDSFQGFGVSEGATQVRDGVSHPVRKRARHRASAVAPRGSEDLVKLLLQHRGLGQRPVGLLLVAEDNVFQNGTRHTDQLWYLTIQVRATEALAYFLKWCEHGHL